MLGAFHCLAEHDSLPEGGFTRGACGPFVNTFLSLDDVFAVVSGAEPELRVGPDVVEEGQLFEPVFDRLFGHVSQHEVLVGSGITICRHTAKA